MTEHIYIEKIKSGKDVRREEKEEYIKTLTFNSNKIIINDKSFNMNKFSKDFDEIISNNHNLYVYLDFQDLGRSESLVEKDYKDIYDQSIKNIDQVFGVERIILHSSKMFRIDNKTKMLKAFLIYSENTSSDKYLDNQKSVKKNISLMSNLPAWNFKDLISSINQMQLYKTLYIDLFSNNSKNKISNFIETARNDKVFGVGIIKKTTKDTKGIGQKYTINSFKIEPEFSSYKEKICFKFNVVTNVFVTTTSTSVFSNIKTYNNKTVQMAILGDVNKIPNYYDKKSITFNVKKFDDSKFHLYCSSIDILKNNPFTKVLTANIEKTLSILENESFYKNNIKKSLTIGFVYEEHLDSKIDEYIYYFNEMLINDAKWIDQKNIKIELIKLEKNLEIINTINTLKSYNCDAFICLTDIDIFSEDYNESENINDYYKNIKNYILNQNLEKKETLITQGLIVVSDKEVLEENEDYEQDTNKSLKDKKKATFEDKIKTSFYELCTKYIFYNNLIQLNSSVEDGNFYIMSFNAPKNLACLVEIKVKNSSIEIINKELFKTDAKNGNEFKKDPQLISWLSQKITNYKEVLDRIKSYDDFVIYDIKENSFLLCSNEQTYLLSDNEYSLRKDLILTHRAGKTYPKKKKDGTEEQKESLIIMPLLIPLYNIPKSTDRQIYLFNLNDERYYFVGNDLKKTSEHPQSPLVKMYFNENNEHLLNFYFKFITCNVVRNSLNTKTTLLEKFSKIHMVN